MIVDLSEVPQAVRSKMDEVVRRDYDLAVLKAIERQKRAAAARHRNPPRWRDGFGEMRLSLDPVFDVMYRHAWGHRWTEDEERVKWVLKHCPEARVRCVSGKVMVSSPGLDGCRKRVKNYG